jgi:hypothetical protein
MTPHLIATAIGLIVGCPVALIWVALSRRLPQVDFWSTCRLLLPALIASTDPREFTSQYGQLLKLLVRYLIRNLTLTAAASLPVVLSLAVLTPVVEARPPVELDSVASDSASETNSFWTLAIGPEGSFFVGLSVTSATGICLFSKRQP